MRTNVTKTEHLLRCILGYDNIICRRASQGRAKTAICMPSVFRHTWFGPWRREGRDGHRRENCASNRNKTAFGKTAAEKISRTPGLRYRVMLYYVLRTLSSAVVCSLKNQVPFTFERQKFRRFRKRSPFEKPESFEIFTDT